MKKLMFSLAVAGLCGAVFADVEGSGVVGYANQDSVKGPESTSATTYYKAPGMGVSFFPVGGATEFDLRSITVEGMDADSMWIRVLSPNDSGTTARYTYVSEAYMGMYKTWITNWEKYIGWWDKDLMVDASKTPPKQLSALEMMMNGNDSAVIKEAKMFPVGTAFLGVFNGSVNVKFLSSGEVEAKTTMFAFGTAKAPYFKNYLPVDTKLSDVIPVVLNDKGEIDTTKSMDADSEWLRVISSDDTGTTARYTYVSEAYMGMYKTWITNWEKYIGWWDKDLMVDASKTPPKQLSALEMMMNGNDSAVIKNADEIPFPTVIGVFSGNKNMAFQFPSAFDLPSAK